VTEFPTILATQLGISDWIAGIILSLFVLLLILLPSMYLTKGKAYGVYIILGMAVLAPLVGLGWFPVYIYIIVLFLIALGFSSKLRDFLGGLNR
jgi:hypothetical protein